MFVILAIVAGVILALMLDITIPSSLTPYVAIFILAALDSVLGALRAGMEKKFNFTIFITGLLGNGLIAAALTYFGKKIGVDLYVAAVLVFGMRLFQNFASTRRHLFQRFIKNRDQDVQS